MRYDADRRRWRLVFRKRTLRRGALVPDESLLRTTASAATAAAAADALDKVAGMIKKAVDRSSGRRVRGEGDRIPAIGTVAPDLPLEKLRNTNIRVDPWSAPSCAPPNALRIRPAGTYSSTPEMRVILCSDKCKAGVFYRACLDLPPAACPRPPARPLPNGVEPESTEADPDARRGPACVLSAGSTHRLTF